MDTRHRPPPMTMRWSIALHAVAVAGVLGGVILYLATSQPSNPDIGPLTYWISAISGAVVIGLVYLLSALRGTGGTQRGRLLATVLLALSPVLLVMGPAMLLAVVPSVAALVLLWLPASSAYIRAVSEERMQDNEHSAVTDLVNSGSSGPRIPWANAMPGNPHQPGI